MANRWHRYIRTTEGPVEAVDAHVFLSTSLVNETPQLFGFEDYVWYPAGAAPTIPPQYAAYQQLFGVEATGTSVWLYLTTDLPAPESGVWYYETAISGNFSGAIELETLIGGGYRFRVPIAVSDHPPRDIEVGDPPGTYSVVDRSVAFSGTINFFMELEGVLYGPATLVVAGETYFELSPS